MKVHFKITEDTSTKKHHNILKSSLINTPLGSMLAISDNKALYLLEFIENSGLKRKIERLELQTKSAIVARSSSPITSIEKELKSYFNGSLIEFTTPIYIIGTPFQKLVWNKLTEIPYGQTRSYLEQANAIGKPTAFIEL